MVTTTVVRGARQLVSAASEGRRALVSGLTGALADARARLQLVARPGQGRGSPLATTATVVVVGPRAVGIAQVGDGAVILWEGSDGLRAVAVPPSDHVNETTFLTSPHAMDELQVTVREAQELRGVAVLTDGLTPVALTFGDSRPHRAFFQPLFSFAASAEASSAEIEVFLASPSVDSRLDDDRSLVIAVRCSP